MGAALERLRDAERVVSVLAPDGWQLFAGQTRVRVYCRRSAPAPRVDVLLDISYGGLAATFPVVTPAIDVLRQIVPGSRPRSIGAWACCDEREGDATYAHGVRSDGGAFLSFYFHGPTSVLAEVGGLDTLVQIADSVEGLPRPNS